MPPAAVPSPNDLLQGTVDLMILKAASLQPMHGWGISQRIQQITRGVLEVNQGALYPALHRLEDQGWLDSEWGTSENNRRAKFYRLTTTGRRQLTQEVKTWQRYAQAVQLLLQAV
jgi:transcriptional regulator